MCEAVPQSLVFFSQTRLAEVNGKIRNINLIEVSQEIQGQALQDVVSEQNTEQNAEQCRTMQNNAEQNPVGRTTTENDCLHLKETSGSPPGSATSGRRSGRRRRPGGAPLRKTGGP